MRGKGFPAYGGERVFLESDPVSATPLGTGRS